jgi:hypothetical protein
MTRGTPQGPSDHVRHPCAGPRVRSTPVRALLRTWGALLGLLLEAASAYSAPPNNDITQATVITVCHLPMGHCIRRRRV